MLVVITIACLAIEIWMPSRTDFGPTWLLLGPSLGLIFGSIPAAAIRNRMKKISRQSEDQADLISLLMKDYSSDRGDWLWSCDAEGKLHGITAKFAECAGVHPSALEGAAFIDFLRERLPDRSTALAEIVTAMRQRKPFFDIEVKVASGSGGGERWWRLAAKPVFREGRFTGYIGTSTDFTAEVVAKETVNFLAYSDGLTGLSNRSHFAQRLNECVARLERYGTAFSVCYLDLDKFKAVNDSRGHQCGDRLLVEVANRLRRHMRSTDTVARLGGDEFAVIMPDQSSTQTVEVLAGRLIEEIGKPFEIDDVVVSIGLSIGIAMAPINGTRPDQILRNADLALYRAKAEGGSRCRFFESRMDSEMRERRILELEMTEALETDEFVLHYQPLIATADGTISGFEALIRWNHPMRGQVPPSEFIPIAERSTLIEQIGEWTVAVACRQLAILPEHLTVAVNLSTRHFRNGDIAALVSRELAKNGVAPHRLELEITESLLIDNPEDMALKLRAVKEIGVSIAMDDFGTGFSSLSYLLKFPFDKIKIDRSFVTASSEDFSAREILRSIVSLARTLKIAVTAEGVETIEQADFLRETGCNLLQGYLFSRPLPPESLAAHLGLPPQKMDRLAEDLHETAHAA